MEFKISNSHSHSYLSDSDVVSWTGEIIPKGKLEPTRTELISEIIDVNLKWACQAVTSTHCDCLRLNGVSLWSALPLSPNLILPRPSDPKHMEKEFEVCPSFAKMLGTDISSIPSPIKPFGAAPSKNVPVWTLPQLHTRVTHYGLFVNREKVKGKCEW